MIDVILVNPWLLWNLGIFSARIVSILTGSFVLFITYFNHSYTRSLLIASAGLPAEGIRNIVAECLGRLVFVAPRQLMDRLRQQVCMMLNTVSNQIPV